MIDVPSLELRKRRPPFWDPDRQDRISDINLGSTLTIAGEQLGLNPRELAADLDLDGRIFQFLDLSPEERLSQANLQKYLAGNWVSYSTIRKIVERVLVKTGNPEIFTEIGKYAAEFSARLALGNLIKVLGSTELTYRSSPKFNDEFNDVCDMDIHHITSDAMVMSVFYYYNQPPWDSGYTNGVVIGAPLVYGADKGARLFQTHAQFEMARTLSRLKQLFGDRIKEALDYDQRGDDFYVDGDKVASRVSLLKHPGFVQDASEKDDAEVWSELLAKEGAHFQLLTSSDRRLEEKTALYCTAEVSITLDGVPYTVFKPQTFYDAPLDVLFVNWERPGVLRRAYNRVVSASQSISNAALTEERIHRFEKLHRNSGEDNRSQLDARVKEFEALITAYSHLIGNWLTPIDEASANIGLSYDALIAATQNAETALAGINHIVSEQSAAMLTADDSITEAVQTLESIAHRITNQPDLASELKQTSAQINSASETMLVAGAELKKAAESIVGPAGQAISLIDANEPYLRIIKKYGESLTTLIGFAQALRDMVKSEPEYTNVDLNEQVRKTTSQYKERATFNLELQLDRPAWGQSSQIDLMLYNYLQNAVEATANTPAITIKTYYDETKDMAVLEITDDGPGINTEARPHILNGIYSNKSDSLHTGLGLALNRNFMERAGGRIEFDRSTPDPTFLNYFKAGEKNG